jgi:putative ABC transport system permease protein
VNIPEPLLTVWRAPMTVVLALAGVAIAGLGALLPAHAAARLTIAEVLRTE